MSDPAVQVDGAKMAAVAREHGSLAKLASKYRRFKNLIDEIAELKVMSETGSPDEKELAEAELPAAREAREEVWSEPDRHDRRRRGRQPQPLRDGNPRRHRRRRGGPVRPATCSRCTSTTPRTKGWKMRDHGSQPDRTWAASSKITLAFEGEGVYRELHYEGGDAPRAARARNRIQGARAYFAPRRSPCCPSRKTSKSTSSPTTTASTSSAPAAPAASTSTRPNRPSA